MSEIAEDYTTDELMTVLMAREVKNNDVMIVGVATPMVWAAFTLAKLTHAPDAIYHYIMGNTFVSEPRQVSLLYLEMNTARAYRFQNSCECTLESLPSEKLTTIEFFRPAQVDQFGNFLSREEAWEIARDQKQIIRPTGFEVVGDQVYIDELAPEGVLFSENLY